ILAMAHTLNMEVVAEGVETTTQLNTLRALACDQMQGYLLKRPMPLAAFEFFLESLRGSTSAAGVSLEGGLPA
ncbi:MAG TPA: EAL domain-containing protein, partial [Bordetella sp.]|nr:EAL domain-containing protein [Bordetella sp.]